MTKILVFGGSGLVGSRFIQLNEDFEFTSPTSDEVDILDPDQVKRSISQFSGDIVINFAAFTNVDGAEEEKNNKDGLVYKLNASAPKNIAAVCKENGKYLVHISTDYVFDGKKEDGPYTEEDTPHPINWYGETKYLGEESVITTGADHVIVRLSMPFSADFPEKTDIARFFLQTLKEGNEIKAVTDQKITPVLVDDVSLGLAKLITVEEKGIYHLVSSSSTTPYEMAKKIAKLFSINDGLVKGISFGQYSAESKAERLKNSWLSVSKFTEKFGKDLIHSVDDALDIFKIQTDAL